MTKTTDDTAGWTPLLVRTEDYEHFAAQVAQREKERLGDQSEAPLPAGSDDRDVVDPLAWPESALRRLAEGFTTTTQRWAKAMDVCAEVPGEWLTTTEVAERAGMNTKDWRDAPRKMTQHLRHHYPEVPHVNNKEAWPMSAKSFPGAGQVSWSITPEMARRWKKVRSEG